MARNVQDKILQNVIQYFLQLSKSKFHCCKMHFFLLLFEVCQTIFDFNNTTRASNLMQYSRVRFKFSVRQIIMRKKCNTLNLLPNDYPVQENEEIPKKNFEVYNGHPSNKTDYRYRV